MHGGIDIRKADGSMIPMQREAPIDSPDGPEPPEAGPGHRRLPGFDALKVFCDVGRCRSISQAAADNDLSQPAASLIVRQLERRLAGQLVNRLKRPLQLTALGQLYYEGCKGLVEQYRELEASIRSARAGRGATVHVAAIYSVGLGDMGSFVERFKRLDPSAKVQVDYLHPDQVYERVHEGIADFGLVSFPRKLRELIVEPWRDEEMVLACAPGHPLAALPAAAPAQLAGMRYVAFVKGLTIRREVDRFLKEQGVAVQTAAEFDTIENIKEGVKVGAGVALLPAPTIRLEVRAGTLKSVPLAGCRFVRPLGVIRRRQHKFGAAALHFLELLREAGDHDGAAQPQDNGKAPFSNGKPRAAGRTR
jgi:DNA-binding transcriptional LysR family regulator